MGLIGMLMRILRSFTFEAERKHRRDFYRNEYLKSDAWKRKRYVVLRRDHWRCVHCGAHATQVHHKKYAKYNIGKEPIKWLESVCKSCHDSLHR
jgi:5-methylcytosine-specific restriction endonuclease McrA